MSRPSAGPPTEYGGDPLLPDKIGANVLLMGLVEAGRALLAWWQENDGLREDVLIDDVLGVFVHNCMIFNVQNWVPYWLDTVVRCGVDRDHAEQFITIALQGGRIMDEDESSDKDETEEQDRGEDDECVCIEINDYCAITFNPDTIPRMWRIKSADWKDWKEVFLAGWEGKKDGDRYIFGTIIAITHKDGRKAEYENHNEVFAITEAMKVKDLGRLCHFNVERV